METHEINYEGINYQVKGEYNPSEEEVGYIGGWTTINILIDDVSIYGHLKEWVIDKLGDLVIEKYY